ncbi:MAG: type II and III secretion system protein family protein [Hyphomicrobiales bacterium]|nr:type II and III secretion system protein family protein [Hyphomicrobiales bacterium]
MRFRFNKTLAVAVFAITAVVLQPLTNVSPTSANAKNYLRINKIGTTQRVKLGWNKSMVIDLPYDAHDIMVANPRVADAVTRTSKRLYVFAKQVGETNIFVFDAAGRQILSLDLAIERDIAGVEENIRKYVPGSNVKVEMINDNVILTGTVPTPQSASRVVELARVFVTGGEATTNQFDSQAVSSSGTTIVVSEERDDRQTSQIVNLLQIEAEDQVYLKVTIAEIQRTIVKQLGINLSAAGALGGIVVGAVTDYTNVFNKNLSGTGLSGFRANGSDSIEALVNAMDQAGVLRTLAEPTLTAISGETANFKVGGEYTISDGKTESVDGVTYQSRQVEYGVGLTFTPTVLSPGRISLKIKTEVSEPTSESSYSIPKGAVSSAPIVSIRRREAATTVELPSGGSMVIAGLVKDDVRQSISGFPGLRKIPILGALFGSREFERYETELVIIVTPYLVRPVARQKLVRPDDNFFPASDSAGIFLGQVNRIYGNVDSKQPATRYHGKVGFIYK